ncbi:TMhelix containing protein [Vibrio phage 1.101.O._10N.261.45.C6]|nr:TMhelix containing protein [Vibrio phage 1.101.O._10N.261.45.C6]
MNFKRKGKTSIEKAVYAVFAVVVVFMVLQVGFMVWAGFEVVTSVNEAGGVKEALIGAAKDVKDITDAYKGE